MSGAIHRLKPRERPDFAALIAQRRKLSVFTRAFNSATDCASGASGGVAALAFHTLHGIGMTSPAALGEMIGKAGAKFVIENADNFLVSSAASLLVAAPVYGAWYLFSGRLKLRHEKRNITATNLAVIVGINGLTATYAELTSHHHAMDHAYRLAACEETLTKDERISVMDGVYFNMPKLEALCAARKWPNNRSRSCAKNIAAAP